MMMAISFKKNVVIIFLLALAVFGCRPKQRPMSVLGKSPTALITISGMNEFGTANYSYHLTGTGCLDAPGEAQTAQQMVIVSHPRLKRGLGGCMLMVKATDLLIDVKYTQLDNVLWISNEFAIGQNESGQLVATAQMEKVYEEVIKTNEPITYALQFAMQLPPNQNIKDLSKAVGTLNCSVPVGLIHMNKLKFDSSFKAIYVRKDLEVPDEKMKVECNKLTVTVKVGESLFEFKTDVSSENSFTPAAGKLISLNKMKPYRLALVRSLKQAQGSSVINVELKNGCPKNNWLDVSGTYPACKPCPDEKPEYNDILGRCVKPIEE
jgi:hypothetical protein